MNGIVAVLCIACFYNGVSSGNMEHSPSNGRHNELPAADGADLRNVFDIPKGVFVNMEKKSHAPCGRHCPGSDAHHATAQTLLFIMNTVLSAFEATANNNQGAASLTAGSCPNNTYHTSNTDCETEYDPFA